MSLASFLGVKKFGQGIASAGRVIGGSVGRDIETQNQSGENVQKLLYAARQEKDQEKKKRLLEMAQKIGGTVSAEQIDPGLKLSNKEILGSAANVGLNVAMPGAFKGGKAVVIAKNAALGAGFGTASGLEKNRSASGIVGSTVGGAAIGAGIGVAGLAAKTIKNFATKTTPKFLMEKSIKPALQDLKKNVRFGTKTLGEELLNEGVKGKPETLLRLADSKLNTLESELQSVLSSPSLAEARITRQQITPYLKELVNAKKGVPGLAGEAQRIEGILKSVPEKMTLQQANVMKRRIYTELRDIAYKLDAKLGTRAAALKQIAKGLKTEIENTVGGTVVRDINQKLSIYGRLENSMVDQLARDMRNNGIGLTDAILLAGGDTGILALLRHVGKGVETYAAQGLKKTGEILSGKVAQGMKEVIRKGSFNLP